jgi:type II secretory pathway pseudopilin PulG
MVKTVNAHLRRALTLVEVVASTFIVSLMTVVALDTLGAATRSSESLGDRAVALGMAEELMSEIIQAAYKEPTQTPTFGRETGEPHNLRSAYDDVDDWDGWNKKPPLYRDGSVIPDRDDWRQRVVVRRVLASDPTQTSGVETGVKQIHVTIEYRDQVMVERYAVRTDTDASP